MIPAALTQTTCLLFALADLNPVEIQNLIKTGLQYAYAEAFDSAQIYFNKIINGDPANPAGYFFKAGLLQVKMMDECQFADEKEYLALINQSIKCAEKILATEENPWARYYLGSCYTYRAVHEGLKNNYFDAFKYGANGGRLLQNLIKQDSTFYDAYLGAGSFEYFWARAARYLPVLKLMGGDINEAIRKLQIAADKSQYCGPTALNSLTFIYGEEGHYDRATTIVDSLLLTYPDSKTFLWSKANLEFKKKDYQSAARLYDQLFNMYNVQVNKNYANLAACKLFIGKCFYELKAKENAKAALKEVIGFKRYTQQYPQISKYSREAYGLLSRLL